MSRLYNLARMTTATTGTGTITLASAAVSSGVTYLTFAQAGVANGDTVSYAIADVNGVEIGTGVYTASGTTLTRSVTTSSNANTAINLSGNAQVFITPRREDIANPGEANTFSAQQTFSATASFSAVVVAGATLGSNVMAVNGNAFFSGLLSATNFSTTGSAIAIGPSGTGTGSNYLQFNGPSGSGGGTLLYWAKNGANNWALSQFSAISGAGTSNDFTLYNYGLTQIQFQIGASSGIATWYDGLLSLSSLGGGIGYATGGGAGGAVTQATSRTTGVTLNKSTGAITLFTATGSTTPQTFTVTNSAVAATDCVVLSVKSATNKYRAYVTAVAAGSFAITFEASSGTSSDAPVISFCVIKGSAN